MNELKTTPHAMSSTPMRPAEEERISVDGRRKLVDARKKLSVFTVLLLSLIAVTFLSVMTVWTFWMLSEIAAGARESRLQREQQMSEVRTLLRDQVDHVVDYVDFEKSRAEDRLKARVMERSVESATIAANLYRHYAGRLDDQSLKRLVTDALMPTRSATQGIEQSEIDRPVEYRDDAETDAQTEVLARIESIRFGREGYVFAGRYDGVSLTDPGKGRNMIDIADANGLKIVRELIRTAKSGGGFVQYVMPALNGRKHALKLSYVRGIPAWGWYVGAGVYIDEIDAALAAQNRQLQGRVRHEIVATLAVLAALLLLVFCAARLISRNLGRSFGAFSRFFAAAAAGTARIDDEDLRFREFSELGRYARTMLEERTRVEKEKTQLEDQLRQSQKMQAVGQLAGGVAHDFNNLLTVISGYTELASGDALLSESMQDSLLEIRKAAARAASLTRQLLAFSKRQVMEMRVVSLNAVLAELEKMLCRLIGEDIDLVMRLDPRIGPVRVDPGQLQVAIVNLALNAKDAMPKGGRLTLETGIAAGGEGAGQVSGAGSQLVSISVTDTGTGMTPEVRERIFEPFFTTKSKGTGLGLSTVYGIVNQSGGTMTVTSAPGSGSTFLIILPQVEAETPGAHAADIPDTSCRGNETILLVEDEPEVRQLVQRALEIRGYRILPAKNGAEGLAVLTACRERIDLVLTDVIMPTMSGPEMAARLPFFHPEARVLFMSGYTDDEIVHHGVLEEGVQLLQKPFAVAELTRRVREVLDGPAAVTRNDSPLATVSRD